MDLPTRIRIAYNVKHRYEILSKFGDKFLTSPDIPTCDSPTNR